MPHKKGLLGTKAGANRHLPIQPISLHLRNAGTDTKVCSMDFSAPAKLYFIAAALFLGVVIIGLSEAGPEPKSIIGLMMAGLMVRFALKTRRVAP